MGRTTSSQDDAELLAQFVAARSNALLRTAYLLVGDRGLAQDLLQEALTKTWAAWGRIREPERAEAYCRTALTRTAISWYRRKAWHGERPADVLPERSTGGHEDDVVEQDRLRRALMSLPPRQRAAVVCRYYDDLSEAETAAVMGCAVGTVKSLTHSGLARLRELVPATSAPSTAEQLPARTSSRLITDHPTVHLTTRAEASAHAPLESR